MRSPGELLDDLLQVERHIGLKQLAYEVQEVEDFSPLTVVHVTPTLPRRS